MYQFPNQQLYHYSAYQQCSTFTDHNKLHVTSVIENDAFQHNYSHNIPNIEPNNTENPSKSLNSGPKLDKVQKKSTNKNNVDTSSFSIEERLVAAVWVHERKRTKTSMSQIKHDFRQRFGRGPPTKNTLLVWERKLFSTGSVCDAPRPGRPMHRASRIDEVAASVRLAPTLSLRARARALRLPRTTLRTILCKDLGNTTSRQKDAGKTTTKPKSKVKPTTKKPPQPRSPPAPAVTAPPAACHFAPATQYMPPSHSTIHSHTTYT